jgi:hypothetical protein
MAASTCGFGRAHGAKSPLAVRHPHFTSPCPEKMKDSQIGKDSPSVMKGELSPLRVEMTDLDFLRDHKKGLFLQKRWNSPGR